MHPGFMRNICEAPGDIDLRLIYADYLEACGDPRGEFIRVQCELAEKFTLGRGCGACDGVKLCSHCYRFKELTRREHALLLEYGHIWTSNLAYEFTGLYRSFHRGFIESINCFSHSWLLYGPTIVTKSPILSVRLSDIDNDDVQVGGSINSRFVMFTRVAALDWARVEAGLCPLR